jgi:hypothetical protein
MNTHTPLSFSVIFDYYYFSIKKSVKEQKTVTDPFNKKNGYQKKPCVQKNGTYKKTVKQKKRWSKKKVKRKIHEGSIPHAIRSAFAIGANPFLPPALIIMSEQPFLIAAFSSASSFKSAVLALSRQVSPLPVARCC